MSCPVGPLFSVSAASGVVLGVEGGETHHRDTGEEREVTTGGGRAGVSGLRPLPTAPDQRVSSQERLVPEICAAGGAEGGGTQGLEVKLHKNKLFQK